MLQSLQIGNYEHGQPCSEWTQLISWYDARSDYAHGGLIRIPPIDGIRNIAELESTIRARVLNIYLVPILTWLSEHPVQPVTDLDDELNAMTGWRDLGTE
ncbi:hypothetical protein StoSoilB5_03850 [Arthrobacter sp. StoSoilB5]|nr:hypothetical protein StoSoilB5_03850 [Arthrobacter sp. StoSoilB5]